VTELFGNIAPGWERVQAVVDWVHYHVTFGYDFARCTKTALEVYKENRAFAAISNIWRSRFADV
jgi:hypothetical protein